MGNVGGEIPPGLCCMKSVLYQKHFFVFGGGGDGLEHSSALYCLNLDFLVWRKVTPTGREPQGTLAHTLCLWEQGGEAYLYVFGGMVHSQCLNHVHRLRLPASMDDTASHPWEWEEVSTRGTKPHPRRGHSVCVLDNVMYVFMGSTFWAQCFKDIHALDLLTHTWALVPALGRVVPSSRTGHSLVLRGDKAIVFGGLHYEGVEAKRWLNDVWEYDFASRKWSELHSGEKMAPEGRYCHTSWAGDDAMYIFGGDANDSDVYYGDFHRFSFEDNEWKVCGTFGDSISNRSACTGVLQGNTFHMFGGEMGPESEDDAAECSNAIFTIKFLPQKNPPLTDLVARYLLWNAMERKDTALLEIIKESFESNNLIHFLPQSISVSLQKESQLNSTDFQFQ